MAETMVVVGAGQAGQSVIETLRKDGFAGRIVLIGEEPVAPYQRPPLSKKYLLGEMALERLFFRAPAFYNDQTIETRFGVAVEAIDRAQKTVRLVGGEAIAYDKLALTTGSRPRLLPEAAGGGLTGVYPVRSLADVDAMAAEFEPKRRVLIIGGGYIGLEAAAVAASRGLSVTVIELAERILARVAAEETSAYFMRLHQGYGVDMRVGVGLEALEGDASGRVQAARLSTGERLEIDFAVVGIGILPNMELAQDAGLTVENGIAVDAAARTSDPDIVSAGDCASFPYRSGRIRLESVQNAIDQGAAAAKTMFGQDVSYAPTPWFWSDQYDVKLQIAGLSQGFDRTVVRPGDAEGQQSIWYYRGETLLAVDAMNQPKPYMFAKRWLEQGVSPDPAKVADPAVALKGLV